VLASAARVVPGVDETVATATRVRAVDLRHHGRSLAAAVSLVVVDEVAAARRVASVRAILHRTPAAQRAPVVVHRRATAATVRVVRPIDHTAAADVGPVVVRVAAAAAGVAVEVSSLQLAGAADAAVRVVDLTVAASALAVVVEGRPTATRVGAVELVARDVVRTADMVVRAVHETCTTAGVVCNYLLHATAADAGRSVVDDAVTAARRRAVRERAYAVISHQ